MLLLFFIDLLLNSRNQNIEISEKTVVKKCEIENRRQEENKKQGVTRRTKKLTN